MNVPAGKTLYPLSDSQMLLRMAEIFSLEPRKLQQMNIIGFYVRVRENADPEALEKAVNFVLASNDSLRLRIVRTWKGLRQYISDVAYHPVERLRVDGEQAFQAYIKAAEDFPLPYVQNDLFWTRLVEIGPGDWALVMRGHHTTMDGYSIRLICEQLQAAYKCYVAGEEPPVQKQYSILDLWDSDKKYAASPRHEEDKKFWTNAYLHQRHYSFPAGRRSEFGHSDTARTAIQGDDYQRISALASANSCSLQSLLMSMVALTVYVVTAKDNFAITSISHGRRTFAQKKTVACGMNTMAVFYDLDVDKPISKQLADWYSNYLETMSHSRLIMSEQLFMSYYESIKHGLNFNHGWLQFSCMEFGRFFEKAELEMHPILMNNMCSQFYLAVLDVPGDHVNLDLNYQTHKYSAKTIAHLFDTFHALCRRVLDDPDVTPRGLKTALEAQGVYTKKNRRHFK